MTPTDYELNIDVAYEDPDYADCDLVGFTDSCTRKPAQTVQIAPVQLEELVLACRG